jgi:hypothetical protein
VARPLQGPAALQQHDLCASVARLVRPALLHNIFPERLAWGAGTYVEMGVNNPMTISNTLAFDKCLGWKGVCFEPSPAWHDAIRTQRSCTLVPYCVHSRENVGVDVPMVTPRGDSRSALTFIGVGGGAKPTPGAGRRLAATTTRCVDAGDSLRSLGLSSTRPIDFLSIDVEGAEADVLRCFPFEELAGAQGHTRRDQSGVPDLHTAPAIASTLFSPLSLTGGPRTGGGAQPSRASG